MDITPQGAPRVAAAIYGTILVTAVIAYSSEDDDLGTGQILIAVVVTLVVYWLAHVYTDVLGARMAGSTAPLRDVVRRVAADEWPLVQATIAPAIPLLLGATDALSRSTAVNLALGVALADLCGWGYRAARASHQSRAKSAVSALLAVALGLLVVLLKNLLH